MLENIKFPILYILKGLAWIAIFFNGCYFLRFMGAIPIEKLHINGKLPENWEAAILDHNVYVRGYLINKHIAVFLCTIVLLFISLIFAGLVGTALNLQQSNATARDVRKHNIAKIALRVFGALFFWFVAADVISGRTPA